MNEDEKMLVEIANKILDDDIRFLKNASSHGELQKNALFLIANAKRVHAIKKVIPLSKSGMTAIDAYPGIGSKICKSEILLKEVATKYDFFNLYADIMIGYQTGNFNTAYYKK